MLENASSSVGAKPVVKEHRAQSRLVFGIFEVLVFQLGTTMSKLALILVLAKPRFFEVLAQLGLVVVNRFERPGRAVLDVAGVGRAAALVRSFELLELF